VWDPTKSRTIRQHERRAGVVVAAIVVAIAVVCLVQGGERIGQPSPGFLIASNRIVPAMGLHALPSDMTRRIGGAQLVGMNDAPVTSAAEVEARLAEFTPGTPITYRFRKGAEVFTALIPLRRFRVRDYLVLDGTFFFVALFFALGGLWPLWRGSPVPAVIGFFCLCQTAALFLATGGNAYGPYSFASLHMVARCLLPAAAVHFAASYPEPLGEGPVGRRWLLAVAYLGSGVVAALVLRVANDPSLYKPFVAVVNLLLANAVLLSLARIAAALPANRNTASRRDLRTTLLGTIAATIPSGAVALASEVGGGPVSPITLLAPLAFFPLLVAPIVARARVSNAGTRTALHRLSVLFFDAVQSTFLIAVVAFWFGQSWSQLNDDFLLEQQRQERVESFLRGSLESAPAYLVGIDALVETPRQHSAVLRGRMALAGRDWKAARNVIRELAQDGAEARRRLEARRTWSGHVAVMLVVASLLVGSVQAARFIFAVQRWLIRPIDDLVQATRVMATGDLGYRVVPPREEELGSLARSVNAMAASLKEIQRRVEEERTAREQAAGAARDAERRHVARELHDSVLQDLGAIKLRLEAELRRPSAAGLHSVVDAIIATITGLRRVVDDLRQPDLASLSLAEAISAYARSRAHGQGVAVQIDLPNNVTVADWATRDVYRVAQEAITNAIRHGSPTHLGVYLYPRDSEIVLEVADDGSGFDPQQVVLGPGILGMRERAAALGGDLEITSVPGEGTIVQLIVPSTRTKPPEAH